MLRNLRLPGYTPFVAMLLVVTFHLSSTAVHAQDPDFDKNRLVLIVEEGETVFLVPPAMPTGTSGSVSGVKFGPVGAFETGLLSGAPLAPFLIEVLTTGSSIAGPVGGTFSNLNGVITDEHTAWLTLSPEAPRFAVELGTSPENVAVIVATAEGVITGGTRRYSNKTGSIRVSQRYFGAFRCFSWVI